MRIKVAIRALFHTPWNMDVERKRLIF